VLRKFHIKGLVIRSLATHFCPRHDRPQTHVTHRNRWWFLSFRPRANNNFRRYVIFGMQTAQFAFQHPPFSIRYLISAN